jgi:hypothetical protein
MCQFGEYIVTFCNELAGCETKQIRGNRGLDRGDPHIRRGFPARVLGSPGPAEYNLLAHVDRVGELPQMLLKQERLRAQLAQILRVEQRTHNRRMALTQQHIARRR